MLKSIVFLYDDFGGDKYGVYLFGYPNAERGSAELLSYSISALWRGKFGSCHSD